LRWKAVGLAGEYMTAFFRLYEGPTNDSQTAHILFADVTVDYDILL
jgi:hypothetical protein